MNLALYVVIPNGYVLLLLVGCDIEFDDVDIQIDILLPREISFTFQLYSVSFPRCNIAS